MRGKYSEEFLAKVDAVTGKRARIVVEHILEHGFITTEQLKELGYNHPPRAARDVRDQGVPLVTTRVKDSTGRRIGTYTFGDQIQAGLVGRSGFSKKFKKRLIDAQGPRCAICRSEFEERYLQPDHRVPFRVAGDQPDDQRKIGDYMLLDGACNRAKDWSCENCPNIVVRDPAVCRSCYWAHPEGGYDHVATVPERREALVWSGDEVEDYHRLQDEARAAGLSVPAYLKRRLRGGR